MPGNRSPSSDIIDRLQLALFTERETAGLCQVDAVMIAAALDQIAALTDQVRLGNRLVLDELDAIADHLGTLVSFRRQKITASVGRGRPSNMLPAEAAYLDGLTSLTAALEDAWGLKA